METLESLRVRVETARELHSVVRTMKAASAVTIRQFRESVSSVREYSQSLEIGFQVLLRSYPDQSIESPGGGSPKAGRIVFGSDLGMCGPFNERMSQFFMDARPQPPADADQMPTIAVGSRVSGHLTLMGIPIEATHVLPGAEPEIAVAVDRLLLHIDRWRQHDGVDHLYVYYHRLREGVSYEPRERQVLPIDPAWLDSLRHKPWPSRRLPTHSMDRDALLAALVRQYIFIELYRAFAESLASENASRLQSMQVAERNIEERIEELQSRYHELRHQSVTQELLDIVSGYAAVTDSDHRD